MKNVYVFLADGFEEVEALTVVDLIRRSGISCTMISVKEGLEVEGAHGIKVIADEIFEYENYVHGEMIVLPGGMPGTLNLKNHSGLKQLIKYFNENKKLIAAICAAPSILGDLGVLIGKCAISYPSVKESLMGAVIIDSDVVSDGNIITSKGVGTAIQFSLRLIETLLGEETSEKIKSDIIYMQ